MDHRDDDDRGSGYCPVCKRDLRGLTNEAKGFCEIHGWVFADFQRDDREDQLAKLADEEEQKIMQAVEDGAETLDQVFDAVPPKSITRYAFFRAINEGRLVLDEDRKLRMPDDQ